MQQSGWVHFLNGLLYFDRSSNYSAIKRCTSVVRQEGVEFYLSDIKILRILMINY